MEMKVVRKPVKPKVAKAVKAKAVKPKVAKPKVAKAVKAETKANFINMKAVKAAVKDRIQWVYQNQKKAGLGGAAGIGLIGLGAYMLMRKQAVNVVEKGELKVDQIVKIAQDYIKEGGGNVQKTMKGIEKKIAMATAAAGALNVAGIGANLYGATRPRNSNVNLSKAASNPANLQEIMSVIAEGGWARPDLTPGSMSGFPGAELVDSAPRSAYENKISNAKDAIDQIYTAFPRPEVERVQEALSQHIVKIHDRLVGDKPLPVPTRVNVMKQIGVVLLRLGAVATGGGAAANRGAMDVVPT